MNQTFADLDAWATTAVFSAAMLAGWAAGWWRGRSAASRPSDASASKFNDAILALLGLLLAFTFSMALGKHWEPLEFELPYLHDGQWRRWIDTALDSPDDIVPWEQASELSGDSYRAADRSVVMLYAQQGMRDR